MKALITALLAAMALCAPAHANMILKQGGGATYVGPGDVATGATHFVGFVALDAAKAAAETNLVEAERNGGNTCILKSGTNGLPNLTALVCTGGTEDWPTFCANSSPNDCRARTVYDQGGTPTNYVQTTRALQIPILLNCSGTLPCFNPADNSDVSLVSSSALMNQPFSFVAAAQRTGGLATRNMVKCGTTGFQMLGSTTASNTLRFVFGSTVNFTATDNAFHAIQTSVNGASSFYKVDAGSSTSANPGTSGCAANVRLGSDGTVFAEGGKYLFWGNWAGTEFDDYDEAQMNTVIHTIGQF